MTDFIRAKDIFPEALLAATILIGASLLLAQAGPSPNPNAPAADASADVPKYDVSTIKPAASSEPHMMMAITPDGVSIKNIPIQMVLRDAFNVEDDRIVGAPAWVRTNHYNVEAKVAPEDAPKLEKLKLDQRQSMMLPLLVERLSLKYHHETRELPMYSLVVAKGGPKMKASESQDPPSAGPPGSPDKLDPAAPPPRRSMRMMGRGHIEAEGTNMQVLAHILSQQLGRSVTDKTGLTGNYDYTLQWTPDDAPPPMGSGGGPGGPGGGPAGGPPHNDSGSDAVGPSLFTAVQEQLGLKLESGKGTVDVIVIDHIDPPSEN